ncbi:MAG: HAMP domain-containing sensor histidine kinase [bacterium]
MTKTPKIKSEAVLKTKEAVVSHPLSRFQHNCFLAKNMGVFPFLRCRFCPRNLRNCFGFQFSVIGISIIILVTVIIMVSDIPVLASQIVIIILFLVGLLSFVVSRETNEIVVDSVALSHVAEERAKLLHKVSDFNKELEKTVADRTAELMRVNFELDSANQAKTEFLHNVSHELRTPLTSLIGYAQILQEEAPSIGAEQLKQIQGIERNSRNLLRLINDLLSISRIESGKMELSMENIQLLPIVDDMFNIMKSIAAVKNITLEQHIEIGASEIYADEEKLEHILMNLLDNAIKYTPPSGKVTLWITEEPDDVKFIVQDNGIGMKREDMERIFDKFTKGDNAEKGSMKGIGLGLAIVKSFVEAQGGKIWVESEEDKGSKFIFTLPKKR